MVDRRPFSIYLLVFLAMLIVLGWGQQVNANIYDEYNETEYQEQERKMFDSIAHLFNPDDKWPVKDNKSQVLYLFTIYHGRLQKEAMMKQKKLDDEEKLKKLVPKQKRESLDDGIKDDQRMLEENVNKYVDDAYKHLDNKRDKTARASKENMTDESYGMVWARLHKLAKRTNKQFAENQKSSLYNKTKHSQRALDLKSAFSDLNPSHYIAVEHNITKPFKNEDTMYNFYIRINVFVV